MKTTTMRISHDNFWALEKFRVSKKIPSKDLAIRRLLEIAKDEALQKLIRESKKEVSEK